MLSDEEINIVVNKLSSRHNWYEDNLETANERFVALSAEVGISAQDLEQLIYWLLEHHYPLPPEVVAKIDPFLKSTLSHAIWAGIEIGKRIGVVLHDPDSLDNLD